MTSEKRPVPRFRRTRLEWNLEFLTLVALIGGFVIVFLNWSSLPERIPIHFGFDGRPDRWVDSKLWILLLPCFNLAIYILFLFIGRRPYLFNYAWKVNEKNAPRQYRLAIAFTTVLKTELIVSFTYALWRSIQVARGQAEGLGAFFLPIFLILIAATVVIYLRLALRAR